MHAASTGTSYGESASVVDETTTQTVRARYLVGADGGRSLVRARLGSEMTGKSFPERWLVVDLAAKEASTPSGTGRTSTSSATRSGPRSAAPNRAATPVRVRAHRRGRQGALRGRGDRPPAAVRHVDPDDVVVLRRLVYTFNALVADRWRDRRVLLGRDAAHMTPQFVGQGMNAGIRDADNLSWKLEAILGTAPTRRSWTATRASGPLTPRR